MKILYINQKLDIMAMREDAASWVKFAQEKKINKSTVRSIYAKKEDMRAKGKNSN